MGISHKRSWYIDICPSFGSRCSSAAQQRVSTAVCHLLSKKGFTTLAYVNDFCGAHCTYSEAVRTFSEFETICDRLGLKIAPEKSAYPSTRMEWLGFVFDTVTMEVTIPESKLQEIIHLADEWTEKPRATRREYQSIAGKLNHIALCVIPARRFMARILTALRATPLHGWIPLPMDVRLDIAWFARYAQQSNGRYFLRPVLEKFHIKCDACLIGGGAFSSRGYYSLRFPLHWMTDHHISCLEALNFIIAVKSLIPPEANSIEVIVKTDNIASAYALTTGRACDPILAACARELWLVAAVRQLTITVEHAPGETLVLADALTRRHKSPDFERYIAKTVMCDHVLTPEL